MASSSSDTVVGEKIGYILPEEPLGGLILDKLRKANKNKIALINAITGASLTYGEVLKQSIKLAVALKESGLEKGDVVAIVSENLVNWCIVVLASLYVGAVVNPLNPSYSFGEMKRALDLSTPKIIFCSENSQKTITEVYEKVISVEKVILFGETIGYVDLKSSVQCINGLDVNEDAFVPSKVSMDDAAFILCSSGTTGFPKAVLLPHRCPCHFISCRSNPSIGTISSDSVFLEVLPFFHLGGGIEPFSCLYNLGTNVVIGRFKPELFLKAIQDHKVTTMILVSSLMAFLSSSPLIDKYDLSSLEQIWWGGASLDKTTESAVIERLKSVRFRQIYGFTEIGAVCIVQMDLNKRGCAGRLMENFYLKVCEPETDAVLGSNKVGELRLKSSCVMKGYLQNPQATAEAFDKDGYLKTGDAGYYDEEGNIYIVDRLKELIKYNGFQVSPTEIEAVLLTHPAVKEAAVVSKPDNKAGEIPVAFVVKQDGKEVLEQELIDLVKENLSAQKRLYGGVRFVNEIPKSNSQKILRMVLKEAAKTM